MLQAFRKALSCQARPPFLARYYFRVKQGLNRGSYTIDQKTPTITIMRLIALTLVPASSHAIDYITISSKKIVKRAFILNYNETKKSGLCRNYYFEINIVKQRNTTATKQNKLISCC
jgi:hypothetical protein